MVLAIVMGLIFVIGFFLDFIEITFIHVPVLAPIMIEFGYDPVWFCILIAVNLQTSFMTPPFGFSLFYLKAVTPPEISTGHIYRGIIPFVIVQIIGLAIVVLFPQLATWLPKVVFEPIRPPNACCSGSAIGLATSQRRTQPRFNG
jgi:TRAP-type mannitol/chloroaromatic compound transport system permease large subunit